MPNKNNTKICQDNFLSPFSRRIMFFLMIAVWIMWLISLFSSPVSAEEYELYSETGIFVSGNIATWGAVNPSSAQITIPDDYNSEGHVADVTINNTMATLPPDEIVVVLTIGELSVTLYYNHGDGTLPDTATVIPPNGYLSIPQEVIIEEYTSVTFQIFKYNGY